MTPNLKFDTHPDAESLNAFIEQALAEPERAQILSHLAGCGRCRQVVYLAREAAEIEVPEPAPVRQAESRRGGVSWFGNWRWAWIPAAALAGMVTFAVVEHSRRTNNEREMALNTMQKRPSGAFGSGGGAGARSTTANPPAALANNRTATALNAPQASGLAAGRIGPAEKADEIGGAKKDQPASAVYDRLEQVAAAPAPILPLTQRDAGVSGTNQAQKTARTPAMVGGALTKPSTMGGPMNANQMTQQNNVTQLQQSTQAELKSPYKDEAAAAQSPIAKESSASGAGLATGQQQTALSGVTLAIPAQDKKLNADARNAIALRQLKNAQLPSGLTALSAVSVGTLTVAIDPAGAMFLSGDGGRNWSAVPRQWTGRAVLLEVHPPEQIHGTAAAAQFFQLTNDNLETWVSRDGKIWTSSSPVQK